MIARKAKRRSMLSTFQASAMAWAEAGPDFRTTG
jgi:hypothetical protein